MTSLSNKKIILTVVRHGQTNGNKESILQGQNGTKVFLNSHLEIFSIHKVIWQIYLLFNHDYTRILTKVGNYLP